MINPLYFTASEIMEPSLNIFISSIIDAFQVERQALKSMLEAIPFNRTWLFEYTPASSEQLQESYLQRVKECDVFILLLGSDISEAVNREWQTAIAYGKPRLVFLQKNKHSPRASEFVRQMDVKWMPFSDLESLKTGVKSALLQELIRNYKSFRITEPARVALSDELHAMQPVRKKEGDKITVSIHSTGNGPIAAGKNIRQVIHNGNPRFPGSTTGPHHYWSGSLQVLGATLFFGTLALLGSGIEGAPDWTACCPGTFWEKNIVVVAPLSLLLSVLLFFWGRSMREKT